MHSVQSDPGGPGRPIPTAVKILVAGGFGAGKTTLVGTISEVRPLQTEEVVTPGTDDLTGVADKSTTTVAMDFGRITINEDLQIYLFGAPGQDRFRFLWDELAFGALGAVVLADVRRLGECFPSVDYFEQRGIPFVVGVNRFDDDRAHGLDALRTALDIDPDVPVLLCDTRDRRSGRSLLVALVEHVARHRAARRRASTAAAAPVPAY
jgi:signal recognition particle receptor subunit beta